MNSGTWIAIAGGCLMQNGLLNGNFNMLGLIIGVIIATIMLIFAIFVKNDNKEHKNKK